MKSIVLRMLLLGCGCESYSYATQLILNGGFESGNLNNWTVSTETGSYTGSGFSVQSSTITSQTLMSTVGAEAGTYYAVSDTAGSAAIVLSQTFTVPKGVGSVVLSYGLFVNSGSSGAPTPADVNTTNGLDYNQIPSQFGIVSLISGSTNLFSTGANDLRNFYEGVDAKNNPNPYTNYSFNITSLVSGGGTFTLRFGEVNNVDTLNLGVDNVSVISTAIATPEPASLLLSALGIVGLAVWTLRKRAIANAVPLR